MFTRISKVKLSYLAVLAAITSLSAIAQTYTTGTASVSGSGGGTLSYTVVATAGSTMCGMLPRQNTLNYTVYDYEDFTYTDANGTATSLDGGIQYVSVKGITTDCDTPIPPSATSPLILTLLPTGVPITFVGNTFGGSGFASLGTLIDPQAKVISILYATPGNKSQDGFSTSKTNGTVTTISQDFATGQSVTFSGSAGIIGGSLMIGNSSSTGSSSSFTESVTGTSMVDNTSAPPPAPNTIDHSQDMFILWVNPEIVVTGNALPTTGTYTYSVRTPYLNGVPEQASIVEVFADEMQSHNGATNVELAHLQRQFDPTTGANDLPGLASLCADQSQYINNCPLGGQCGCVPSDFANILANDPLVNVNPALDATTAIDPTTVDVSGMSACNTLTATNNCRYVPVPASLGSTVPMEQILAGPVCGSGCNGSVNSYTQTDTTINTQTSTNSVTETIGFSVKIGPPVFNATIATTMSWTDSESVGSINQTQNSIEYSLSSGTPLCSQDVLVYEDTIFHTFVTRQAPGNTSCP